MAHKVVRSIRYAFTDHGFLTGLKLVETWVSKILSMAMVAVLISAVMELCLFLGQEIWQNDTMADPDKFFSVALIKVFGLFLNILIALEILENITAYLKKHVVHLELVIITSLTAVARKIIIFDFKTLTGLELVGLALAVVALAYSYYLVRKAPPSHDFSTLEPMERPRKRRRPAETPDETGTVDPNPPDISH
jgi:uncharacterized membrane protein (DUF373 family)